MVVCCCNRSSRYCQFSISNYVPQKAHHVIECKEGWAAKKRSWERLEWQANGAFNEWRSFHSEFDIVLFRLPEARWQERTIVDSKKCVTHWIFSMHRSIVGIMQLTNYATKKQRMNAWIFAHLTIVSNLCRLFLCFNFFYSIWTLSRFEWHAELNFKRNRWSTPNKAHEVKKKKKSRIQRPVRGHHVPKRHFVSHSILGHYFCYKHEHEKKFSGTHLQGDQLSSNFCINSIQPILGAQCVRVQWFCMCWSWHSFSRVESQMSHESTDAMQLWLSSNFSCCQCACAIF